MAANPAQRKDPLPVFCFKVKVVGGGEAFFRSVSGLRYETEVIPVLSGGTNDTTFQLPGATKWSNIVLKQGFTSSSALIGWRTEWIRGTMKRVNGTITQLDTALEPRAQWDFVRAWPCKWELSDLDASKSELAIETLELAIEGLKFTPL
jgi:phage tail-like protein